ncbi:acyl-CoA-binding domain-containing protein 4-like isoform X2 [Sesamum indicum]|uniref:Acyl-CoA-binding domain-containing protein 4-like isoform X2 n=1 Tax=Sesamum indicum TaxID=4182 RepID=A0A6I9U0D9_SESIN|nr:acyl-CoA-binding domain-containing protein 4-like isoform X2 [Sesamum indicum]
MHSKKLYIYSRILHRQHTVDTLYKRNSGKNKIKMGSLGEVVARNKAMWLCPKMMGSNPSERWGHSACYFNGLLYIFGGCRGGVHFSDVLVCNLATMTWSILKTSGPGPGPRDSHTAVLVGHRMLVFGGTNGSKKVNDLHVLDLVSREWMRPECRGNPPSARESHTANVVGDEKLVVFGGSGEGEANYLNDLHILDLKNMEWSSPEVSGNVPAPRDSHSSVAVGNRLFVFGGDSGDRYQGDVSVLDLNKLIWSRLDVCGPSPDARAGHAAVSVGTKVYMLGGVGDKQYYSDIWVLDVITSSWDQLDLCSQKSQGRFSHTATVTTMGIAIFGGCGEDERPLNELLILPIDSLTCRAFGNTHKDETKMFFNKTENNNRTTILIGDAEDLTSVDVEELESVPKQLCFSSDMLHPKRRRTSNSNVPEQKSEPKEQSRSQSQQSSPSQSEHEPTHVKKSISCSYPSSRVHPLFRQKIFSPTCYRLNTLPVNQTNTKHGISRMSPDLYLSSEHPNQIQHEHANVICADACRAQCKAAESVSVGRNLIGAEVRGQVDGAFDSGYLMTATVNGKVFRGVLFAPVSSCTVVQNSLTPTPHPQIIKVPKHELLVNFDTKGPDVVSGGAVLGQQPSLFAHQIAVNHANSGQNVACPRLPQQPAKMLAPPPCHSSEQTQTESRRSSPENRALLALGKDSRVNSELQGVVLTLASPGTTHGRL